MFWTHCVTWWPIYALNQTFVPSPYSSSRRVGVASEKGAPPPVAAKPVNVDIKSLTAKARQDALEQRHQELLSRQKALQEQYQRLQNMQKKNPTAPTNSAITPGGNGNSLTNG